jgi:hypothetical protein
LIGELGGTTCAEAHSTVLGAKVARDQIHDLA